MNTKLYRQDSFVLSAADINATIAAGVTGQQFAHATFGPRGWRKLVREGWATVESVFSGSDTQVLKR